MKEDILCKLHANAYSDVWLLWNWNFRKWQWPPHNFSMQTTVICPLVFTSKSDTSTVRGRK